MKDIVIVGCGGFARETKWIIDRINSYHKQWNFCGYISKNAECENVLGDDGYLDNISREISVVIAIGNPRIREQVYNKYKKNLFLEFPNIIDPAVAASDNVKFGKGNIICANNIITVDVSIGDFNIINLNCTIGHDVIIGNFNTINPGTNISGNVTIGRGADIGTGTKIIQGVKIQDRAMTGAGATVIRDVPRNALVVGVPAVVKKVYDSEVK